jgi:hypothetical protein
MEHKHKYINNHFLKEEYKELYSMRFKLRLRVFSSLLLVLVINCSYSQQMVGTFTVNDCTFIHTRKQLDKMVSECSDYLNKITIKAGGKVVFENSICGVDVNDVQFIHKGYITVLEHYSSPVGWFEYIVFDVCKNRIITTKRIDEGVKINWEEFIELKEPFKTKYVEQVTNF